MRRLWLPVLVGTALLVQHAAAAETVLRASLDCEQANNGVGTCALGGSGTGTAIVTYDSNTNLLSWRINWSGVSTPTNAIHFHGPAFPNSNGAIKLDVGAISGLVSPSIGSATIPAGDGAQLLGNLWFLNIHTDAFAAGEIRGHVLNTSVPAASEWGLIVLTVLGLTLGVTMILRRTASAGGTAG